MCGGDLGHRGRRADRPRLVDIIKSRRQEHRGSDFVRDIGDAVARRFKSRQVREDSAVLSNLRERHVMQNRTQRVLTQECTQFPLGPKASSQVAGVSRATPQCAFASPWSSGAPGSSRVGLLPHRTTPDASALQLFTEFVTRVAAVDGRS